MTQPNTTDVDVIERKTVFQGYFRVDEYRLRHRIFDGSWSGEMQREIFERGHATAVLLYDPDMRVFVMCEQFRVGAFAGKVNPWQIEVVAGVIEEGETPEDVGRREAEEEAGCTVTDLWLIQLYLPSPGACSETVYLYLGRVSAKSAGGIFGVPGEDEHIRASIMTEEELRQGLDDGRFTNAATLISAQWFFLNRDKILARWTS